MTHSSPSQTGPQPDIAHPMISPGYAPVVEVTRGRSVESIHLGAVAVAEAGGRVVAWVGDPHLRTYLRSSAKPLQAIPLVESGAAASLAIPPEELAVVCGSHSGSPEHTARVAALQARAGISEGDLRCGTHPPFDSETTRRLHEFGRPPTPNHNNCSGKHTGMLALARRLGAALDTYLEPDHPVQQAILQTLREMADLESDEIEVAVDGCSAPTYSMPLAAAATAFARLADPANLAAPRREACRQIYSAMAGHPEMVAGGSSFDTAFIRAGGGGWISKGGAEGYFAVGVRPGVRGKGSPGLGIAAKVADGDAARRAGALLILTVLQELAVISALPPDLAEFGPRPLRNWNGRPAAGLRPCFRLARA